MRLTGPAPAKINLFLHVGPVQADGYHPLASLVAFADVGDVVTVAPADTLSLKVVGPFAAGLDVPDNLILTALRVLGRRAGIGEPPLAVTLDKRLPVAAGLGGGSSDAGTALRLASRILALDLDEAALETVSAVVGADGPMCLRARSVWAEGRGDRLADAPEMPPLHAVLVNPGVPSPTGAVYRAYDARPVGIADRPPPPSDWSAATLIGWLAEQRNDLQSPAVAGAPQIAHALEAMGAAARNRLSRMSGSGATVFGLFDDAQAARAAASALAAEHGVWWVTACVIGDSAACTSQ